MREIVQNVSQNAFITQAGKGLPLYPQSSDEDENEADMFDEDGVPIPKNAKKNKYSKFAQKGKKKENMDMQNLFSEDPSKFNFINLLDKIDIINNLNQIKLLQISEHFEIIPDGKCDLAQFVKIMSEVLRDSALSTRVDFISELVDLYYRIQKDSDNTIKFDDITTYLIDHEIAFDSERNTSGAFNASNSSALNMEYLESKTIKDTTAHKHAIEKICYFQEIDRMVLYERSMKSLRVYDGATMKWEADIDCK